MINKKDEKKYINKYHISSKHLNINTKKLMCQHRNCKHKSKSIKQRLMHHDKLEEFCVQEKNLLINLVMFYQESTACLLDSQLFTKKEEKKKDFVDKEENEKNQNKFKENELKKDAEKEEEFF